MAHKVPSFFWPLHEGGGQFLATHFPENGGREESEIPANYLLLFLQHEATRSCLLCL